ncbi:hypothetical protein DE146DRAFT_606799 [Phaeosphaeria sp. MPI-PUGE-AT-0046c]|nr:hypothetical protein DE146DRAFT_606799 [Phaeosphaeria sp. MPI-PUGE-AT-0046c]
MTRHRRRATNKKKNLIIEYTAANVAVGPETNFDHTPTEAETVNTATPVPKQQLIDMAKDSAPCAATIAEYEEDIFLDEELEVAAADTETSVIGIEDEDVLLEDICTLAKTNGHASAAEEREQQHETEGQAKQRIDFQLEQAKAGMAWSTETMLTQTPEMATALQLNKVGDAVTIPVTANGVIYEVTWKVAAPVSAIEPKVEQPSSVAATITATTSALRDASPLSASLTKAPLSSGVKCRFGRTCNKGASCPYDHATRPKLCSYVNTAHGCSSRVNCEFSHENEGMKCTRSMTRYTCPNGRGCAFKHGDDWAKLAQPAQLAKKSQPEEMNEYGEVDAMPPMSAPTGPKAGRGDASKNDSALHVGGQKRAREDDEEEEKAAQRPRLTHNNNAHPNVRGGRPHRARGRGAVQWNGRGGAFRGRGGVMGLNIRGAATRGVH